MASSGWLPGSFMVRSRKCGSRRYCAAWAAAWRNRPSNSSRAHCSVCSMALGKFFSVQYGIVFSGGS